MPFLADYFQWWINTQLASGFCVQMGLNPPRDTSIHYRESVEMNPLLCQSETVAAEEHWDVQPQRLKSALLCSCLLRFAVEFTQVVFSDKWICSVCKHAAVAQRFGSNNLKSSTLYKVKPPALIARCVAADCVSSRSVHGRSEKTPLDP